MIDYNKIFLSSQETEILSETALGMIVKLRPSAAERLLSLGFISHYTLSGQTSEYVATPDGLRYMEYLNKEQLKEKISEEKEAKKFRREMNAAWASIIVSAMLSLASMLISLSQ